MWWTDIFTADEAVRSTCPPPWAILGEAVNVLQGVGATRNGRGASEMGTAKDFDGQDQDFLKT